MSIAATDSLTRVQTSDTASLGVAQSLAQGPQRSFEVLDEVVGRF